MADKTVPFSHLHLHTEHSVLDGACRMDRLMGRVKELGMEHVGITDHGVMSGIMKFQKAADKAGIKPVLGVELYWAKDRTLRDRDDDGNRYYHLTALAENDVGLANLFRIVAEANRTGFYYKARADAELLKKHGEGIIILSGCMAAPPIQQLLNENDKYPNDRARLSGARDELIKLADCVGKDNLYVELQNAGVEIPGRGNQVQWNTEMASLAKDLGLLTTATGDVHYINKEDANPHDAMLCVQTKSLISTPHDQRMSLLPKYYHIRSYQEMAEAIKEQPESLATTVDIANRCDARVRTVSEDPALMFERLPNFPLPEDFIAATPCPPGTEAELWRGQQFLKEWVYRGLYERYGSPLPADVVERAEYELGVINNMGVTHYFLIIGDLIRECNERGVPTGPGRGCLLPEQMIWTPNGYRPIADFKIGDEIMTHNGELAKVWENFEYDVDEDIHTIRHYFDDGVGLKLTADHKVWIKRDGIPQWMEAKNVCLTDFTYLPHPHLTQRDTPDTEWYNHLPCNWGEYDGEGVWLKVTSHNIQRMKTKVHDLGVGHKNTSFTTRSCAVHNSGAGSIVLYALKVTKLDPIKYSLLFERFLNPERISLPDVDQDLGVYRRKEMMEYMKEKYGEDYTAQIVTFARIGSKAGIRKAAMAMGRDYLPLADKMAKMIPTKGTVAAPLGAALRTKANILAIENPKERDKAFSESSWELQQMIDSSADAKKIIEIAKWMEGMVSAESVHAAALVVSPVPLPGIVPVQHDKHGGQVTAFDMKDAEDAGLLKLDFLGLRNLDIIQEAVRLIDKQRKCQDPTYVEGSFDPWEVPLDNVKTFEMLARGDSVGVFQFECLAGDTIINGEARTTIADMYANPPEKLLSIDIEEGRRRQNKVLKVVQSGEKQLYKLVTPSGYTLRASADHKIMTDNGWKSLGDITSQDSIVVNRRDVSHIGACPKCINQTKSRSGACTSCRNKERDSGSTMCANREATRVSAANRPWWNRNNTKAQVEVTGLLDHCARSHWEADTCLALNVLEIEYEYDIPYWNIFVERKGKGGLCGKSKSKEYSQYPIDVVSAHQIAEFELANPILADGNCPKLPENYDFEPVLCVIKDSIEMTYDIMMEAPFNNFIANGIMVHNSGGMSDSLKTVGADQFEDLVAIVALYRPGPMAYIPVYGRRKQGVEPVTYGDPRLEKWLGTTYGICVSGDTFITDAHTGERVALRDMKHRKDFVVQGVDSDNNSRLAPVTHFIESGTKPCVRIQLSNGLHVDLTADHRILTHDGWKAAGEILPGEFVASPQQMKTLGLHTSMGADKLRVLAYLIADGGLTATSSISFYNSDPILKAAFTEASLACFADCKLDSRMQERNVERLSLVRKERIAGSEYHTSSSALSWLRELGLKTDRSGLGSASKFVPSNVFTECNESIAHFVAGLWDCDGGITPQYAYYKTISKKLSQDIVMLLQRLGISATVNEHVYANPVRDDQTAYQITVYDTQRFADIVQPHIIHPAKKNVVFVHQYRGTRFPLQNFIDSVVEHKGQQQWTDIHVHGKSRMANVRARAQRGTTYISQAAADSFIKLDAMDQYRDHQWSQVTSVTGVGEKDVYDLTVEGIHSFVGNGIVLHNCIYQEQNMLMSVGVAGFTGGEADTLRKAIGKKNHVLMGTLKPKFIEGAIKNKYSKAVAEQLWADNETAADYSFNRCAHRETIVRLADGSRIPLHQAFVDQPKELLSMWDDGSIRPHGVSKIVQTGRKTCFKLMTAGGRMFKGTAEHRLLTTQGYMTIGDMIADKTELITVTRGQVEVLSERQRESRKENGRKLHTREDTPLWYAQNAERLTQWQASRTAEEKTDHLKKVHAANPHMTRAGTAAMHERIKWLWTNDAEWRETQMTRSLASVRAAYDTGPGYGHCSIASNGMWCASTPERNMCEWLIERDVEFEMHKALSNGRMCDFYFDGVYWEMDGMDRTIDYFTDKYGELPFVVVTPEDFESIVAKHLQLEHVENGDVIVSIKPCGTHMTYDVEMMPDGPLNFVANNVVSHNSHAACYALISYVTAFLKANHPEEYMSALLTAVMDTKDRVPFYLYECRKMEIEVLAPNVNTSFSNFEPTGEDMQISFGLTAIKGVGEAVVNTITEERERGGQYKDLWDFCRRASGVSRSVLDAMIQSGAFDWTKETRKGMLEVTDTALKGAKKIRKKQEEGQASIFESLSGEDEMGMLDMFDSPSISKEEWPDREKFDRERLICGIYVSGHPLANVAEEWERVRHIGLGEIGGEQIGETLTVAGVITGVRTIFTKRDNKRMLIVTMEDLTGQREIVFFPKLVETGIDHLIEEGNMAAMRVKIDADDRGFAAQKGGDDDDENEQTVATRLAAELVFAFNPEKVELPSHYAVRIPLGRVLGDASIISRVKASLGDYPGERPVILEVIDERGEVVRAYQWDDVRVKPTATLTEIIQALL